LSQTAHNSAVYAGQGGNHYAFYVTATDNAGNREAPHAAPDAETTVDKSNHAPAFGATPDIAIDENTTLALDITATDPDASDTLSYSLLAGPAGLQYDALTGHMTWVTGESTGPSTNRITVVVQDNGVPPLSVTNSFNVVVREVNSPPTLAALSNRKINEGQTLTFLALANDGDIPAQTLTFRLGANAPAGAGIDPVTGLFSWRPSNLQGGTNYPISVIAADNGVPSLSATQTFLVTVRDIVADLSLQVGNTNLYVGETNKVPFLLSSGLDLKQVAFTLQQDPVRLSGFWVTDLPAQVFSADITAGASNQARITFTARTNETLQGLLALGRLQFSTDTNPHSAIVSLSVSNLAGVRTDDTLFDRGLGGLSRVFVVGREPILDLQKGGLLRLYGQAGTNYDVLASGNLGPQVHWSLVKHLTLQGRWQDLSQSLTNQSGLFYCARQVPSESLGVSTVDSGHFRLDLRGMLGAAYRIETKTSLPDLWQPVISFTLSNSPKSLNWTNHGEPVRYFRAVRE